MMIFTTWTMNFKMCPNFLKWQTQRNHHFTECYFDLWAHKMLIRGPENIEENQNNSLVMQSLRFFQLSSLIFISRQYYSLWWNKLLHYAICNSKYANFNVWKVLKDLFGILSIIFLKKCVVFQALQINFYFYMYM